MAALRALSQADVAAFYRVSERPLLPCCVCLHLLSSKPLDWRAARGCGAGPALACMLLPVLHRCHPHPTARTPPSPPPPLQERVLDPATRRKLSVHIEGQRPAGAGAAAAAEGGTAAAAEAGAAGAAPGGDGSDRPERLRSTTLLRRPAAGREKAAELMRASLAASTGGAAGGGSAVRRPPRQCGKDA